MLLSVRSPTLRAGNRPPAHLADCSQVLSRKGGEVRLHRLFDGNLDHAMAGAVSAKQRTVSTTSHIGWARSQVSTRRRRPRSGYKSESEVFAAEASIDRMTFGRERAPEIADLMTEMAFMGAPKLRWDRSLRFLCGERDAWLQSVHPVTHVSEARPFE